MKGSKKVSIRTPADMSDVWIHVSRGENVIMWCEGVGYCDGSDSDEEIRCEKRRKVSALEEKNERIEEIVRNLCKKHNWAELTHIGTHR